VGQGWVGWGEGKGKDCHSFFRRCIVLCNSFFIKLIGRYGEAGQAGWVRKKKCWVKARMDKVTDGM